MVCFVYSDDKGLFDQINLRVPGFIITAIKTLLEKDENAPPTAPLLKINLPSNLNSIDLSSLNPMVQGVDFSTLPSSTLQLGLAAAFSNPIPISLSVPFVGAQVLVDGEQLMDLNLQGLSIVPGVNTDAKIQIQASISESPAATTSLRDIIDWILNNRGIDDLAISVRGIVIGNIHALSQITLALPSLSMPSGSDSLDLATIAPWINDISLSSINPQLSSINIETVREGVALGAGVDIMNPAPVSLNVGHASLTVWIDGTMFSGATISNVKVDASQRQDTALGLGLTFGRSSELKERVWDFKLTC
jgi:hypothetical protein